MTERKRKQPVLKRLRRQAVDVDFEGGTLTSDGGLVLLREVDRRLDLDTRAGNQLHAYDVRPHPHGTPD